MKNLIVVVLFFGMVFAAEAGLMLTIDGEAPGDHWPPDGPGVLGVDSDSDILGFEFSISISEGTLDFSEMIFPETWMFPPYVKSSSDSMVDVMGGDFFVKPGPLTVLTGITLVDVGPYSVITLASSATGDDYGLVLDSLIFHGDHGEDLADAGGPYSIEIGETVELDSSGSFSGNGIDELLWQIDGQDVGATVSYSFLVNDLGLSPGIYDVGLKVCVSDICDWDYTTIEIIPEPGTLLLMGLGGALLRRRRC